MLDEKVSQIWGSWKVKGIDTLKIHYCKLIWIQNGLKEQRNQHIKGMEFSFHWEKNQDLAVRENEN